MSEIIYVQENDQKREATEQELAQMKIDQVAFKKAEDVLKAKEAARKSAIQKLIELGLTEEEIASL
jgi:SMC interacting uncharacterized protein involved in chromosome segregation